MKKEWQARPFEECIDSVSYPRKIQRKDFLESGEYPIVSQEDVFINGYWNDHGDVFRIKHPVVIFGDHTRVLKFIDFDFVVGADGVKILQPKEFLIPKFFYYHLLFSDVGSLGYSRHYRLLKELSIVLPPLSEQRRIVGILDEAFAAIAAARANTEKNLQNARALFESHIHSVFTQRHKDWIEKPLGEVCEYLNGKAHEQCIDKDGRFIVINSKFISSEGAVFKKSNEALLLLQPGDIAMVLSDVPNGKALAKCFLVEEANTYTLNQRICLIRSKKFHTKFLFYQLNRNKHFLAFDNGENQTNMRLNQILECPLFLPSITEQENIAARLDDLREETQHLEFIYQQKLDALEALKKSLLNQAFTGEL